MAGITIGPFSFPAGLVAALCAIVAALATAGSVAGAARARTERLLWAVLAGAALAARAAFVARYWSAYGSAPLHALDIRDGGFDAAAGLGAALVLAAWLGWRNHAECKALLAGALAGTLGWGVAASAIALAATHPELPDVRLARLDGGEVALRSFAGRPLVVNLWASWCPPCRREMPVLARAQLAHPGATFVFVNQGEQGGAVRRYLHDQGLALENVVLDPETHVAKAVRSPGLPTTLFFDASGKLVDQRLGELSDATLIRHLDALLPTPNGAAAAVPPQPRRCQVEPLSFRGGAAFHRALSGDTGSVPWRGARG